MALGLELHLAVDHVVLVVPDLDSAAAALERGPGLRATRGGRHPTLGTQNALMPLGGAYLELVAVADESAATSTPFGRAALAARRDGPHLAGWVARADGAEHLDAAAALLGDTVVPMARLTPAGTRVTWRIAGSERLGDGGAVPPVLAWDDPDSAPPFAPPDHPVGRVRLVHVEVGDPGGELARLLPVPALHVVAATPVGVHAVVLDTPQGRLHLTEAALP